MGGWVHLQPSSNWGQGVASCSIPLGQQPVTCVWEKGYVNIDKNGQSKNQSRAVIHQPPTHQHPTLDTTL
eukprot:910592-Amorphochlora_amoeboformis.AAC.2